MINKALILLILFTSLSYADELKPFVYNENGKKDPFAPLVSSEGSLISFETEATVSDIILEGIVFDAAENNLAIINGKIVRVGDKILSFKVKKISGKQVELINGEEIVIVKLKKGGSS